MSERHTLAALGVQTRGLRTGIVLLFFALLNAPAFGSGSGYFRVWFVDPTRPAAPWNDFLGGEIGIVDLSQLRAEYRTPLFRSLAGPRWTAKAETTFAHVETEPSDAPAEEGWSQWREALVEAGFDRPRYLRNERRVAVTEDGVSTFLYFDNCNDAAFAKAAETWALRKVEYDDPRHLSEWMQAQRRVFEHCGSEEAVLPSAAAPDAPALVRSDREYQIAAAQFYAMEYAEAEQRFLAIAGDDSSPWQPWGRYLAARSAIRSATVGSGGEQDLARAERYLESSLDDAGLAGQHARATRLLGFVRFRLDPERQRRRLATALLEAEASGSLEQEHTDFLRAKGLCGASSVPPAGTVEHLLEWTACLDAPRTTETWSHVMSRLEQAPQAFRDVWLLAAASLATGREADIDELLQSLADVPRDRSIAASASYHRARLLVIRGDREAARRALDRELADSARVKRLSDGNRLRLLRAETSMSVREMVGFSIQRPVSNAYYDGIGGPPTRALHPEELERPLVVGATVAVLNRLSGDDLLGLSAGVDDFHEAQLRALLFRVWTLGLLQGTETASEAGSEAAQRLAGLVSGARARRLAHWRSAPPEERDFAAALLFLGDLDLPVTIPPGDYGLRSGAPAWCSDRFESEVEVPFLRGTLPVDDQRSVEAESERQEDSPRLFRFVADAVSERADAAPDDPEVPRALHLIVRRSRFSQCRNGAISKAAFDRLHRDYRSSEWTRKTPYWYE